MRRNGVEVTMTVHIDLKAFLGGLPSRLHMRQHTVHRHISGGTFPV